MYLMTVHVHTMSGEISAASYGDAWNTSYVVIIIMCV